MGYTPVAGNMSRRSATMTSDLVVSNATEVL